MLAKLEFLARLLRHAVVAAVCFLVVDAVVVVVVAVVAVVAVPLRREVREGTCSAPGISSFTPLFDRMYR